MNNQEDPDVERRLLLAVVLSMAVLFLTPYLLRVFYPQVEEVGSPREAPSATEEVVTERTPAEQAAGGSPSPPTEGAGRTGSPLEATNATPREIEVNCGPLAVRLSNVGARLLSARLLGFLNDKGEPVELVPQVPPSEFLRPLSLLTEDQELQKRLSEAVFEVSGARTDRVSVPAELVFEFREGDLEVVKGVRFPREGYRLEVWVQARRAGRPLAVDLVLGTGIGEVERRDSGDFREPAVSYWSNGSVERLREGDLETPVRIVSSVRWAALDSKYFALVAGGSGEISGVRANALNWEGAVDAQPISLIQGAVGISSSESVSYWILPKQEEILVSIDQTAPRLIDYGWFGLLVRPLLVGLKWIYGYVGNFGWAIITLTFLINLALFPIRLKQMVSMRKMSAVQPRLKSIQDKYKRMKRDDPRRQQMNTEVMALYKEHGVNPLGGCLPLVLQMPILFAFYRMLDMAIELRGAPFIWWIKDLSAADPYFVTPIVMGATMVAQQKMTPATGDPAQRRMMMFLPIVFTFFFLNVSSGLAIYFLFSNVFAMILQLAVQQLKPDLSGKPAESGPRGKKG